MRFLQILILIGLISVGCNNAPQRSVAGIPDDSVPAYKVDPFWPKPLPGNWILGQVSGVDVDSKDHIWIIHRPGSVDANEGDPSWFSKELLVVPAPPVLEFDAEGNLVSSWGGPGEGYQWPDLEHGIFVDGDNNIWISGAGSNDHQVLKFTSDGQFLLQIGQSGKTGGSNDTELLGHPAEFDVDMDNKEVYIADGYLNKRVIVFDSETGKYKRHWGAYGNVPDDSVQPPYDPASPPSQQFGGVVHAVRISNDNLVYVCDRSNNRIQVFQKEGTFIKEGVVAPDTGGAGCAWDIDFSHDPGQKYIFMADGTNQTVWVLERETLKVKDHFGRIGRYAGQFIWLHNITLDSHGNIYTAEVGTGKRVQKFNLQ
jgi:DNA-binding beta-propeller fold protein YncE